MDKQIRISEQCCMYIWFVLQEENICVCTMYSVWRKKKHVGYEQKQAGEPPPWEMRIHNTKIIHHSLFMSRGWVLITFTI